jgi:cystathionine beta-lyase
MFNFDQNINRENTNAEKLEARKRLFKTEDITPLWVADMDYSTPSFILDSLRNRLEHPILGYTQISSSYYKAVQTWIKRQHQWNINIKSILVSPSVVSSINIAIRAYTKKNEAVLVQTPVYSPFFSSIKNNNRLLVDSPLVLNNGKYYIDFNDFEQKIKLHSVKLFLLCNPQNPTGRVWLKEELIKIINICEKHNVIIFSDEIHSDLVYKKHKHIPIALFIKKSLIVTANSASKTFNLGGLNSSYVIIEDKKLHITFLREMNKVHLNSVNGLGLIATQSAYENGLIYKQELMLYLEENKNKAILFFEQYLKPIKLIAPEATYLLWIDFSLSGLNQKEIKTRLIEKAKLGLSDGIYFGENGRFFMRLNMAISAKRLDEILLKIKISFTDILMVC